MVRGCSRKPDPLGEGQVGSEGLGRYKLPAAEALEPLYQGDELNLCGLFAIANALRLTVQPVHPLSRHQVGHLVEAGIEYLEAEEALANAICSGMDGNLWRRLSKHLHAVASEATGLRIVQHLPFARQKRLRLDDVLREVERRLLRGQAVSCELGGAYDHYSVICGYSPTSLLLFDSYGYQRVRRAGCAVRGARSSHRHQLDPRMLLVSSIEG